MNGNIYINGLIGSFGSEIGVELIDVITQVKKQPEAQSFTVHINSEGGAVDVGFDIYNYLTNLGLPIKTVGSGLVASIATVIFMSGTERVLKEDTKFMIHLPWGGVDGTADEIESFAKEVRAVEDKLVKFYTDNLGINKEAILPLLKNETWLNDTQTLDLGITTAKHLQIAAKVYFKSNINNSMSKLNEEEKSWFQEKFKSIEALFNSNKDSVKALMLQDANGATLDFADVADDATPVIDDVATVDGEPAEGEYLMPEGETYVFSAGVLTEIKAVEEEEEETNEEVEALKSENESLQEQIEALKTEVSTKEESISNMAKEVKEIKAKITSTFEIDKKSKEEKEQITNQALNALKVLKEKRKNK